ncbi:MAG: RiPP maturation radical SAM C-methyltransferase [Thermodesulfobacteriota bacterium]
MNADPLPAQIRHVMLVASPWPLFNRPSIQISVLKAYLNQHLTDVHIHAWHLFLNIAETIGYKAYQALSQRTWLAETVYAAILHPERTASIEKLYLQYASREPDLQHHIFTDLVHSVKNATDTLIRQKEWRKTDLLGFSVSLCQMTASLYIMREIKRINPRVKIVVGGTTFCGPSARDFLDVFTHIDFIVQGEGEVPLLELIRFFNNGNKLDKKQDIPGIVSRHSQNILSARFSQVSDLEQLPCPEYKDYFQTLQRFSPENRFFPTLPIEASRGCWWKRSTFQANVAEAQTRGKHIHKNGCAFCNLNLQWQGYRTKAPRQVAREIDALTSNHQTLSVAFMDNIMPNSKGRGPFKEIRQLGKDVQLFGEIRANTTLPELVRMQRAGFQEVQVGIESLSAGLLKKMNKGTRVIQNLEIMKHCEMLGLKNSSNLILGFPGSEVKDVTETLEAIDFAMPFQPLKPVRFWLGLESPVWKSYREFNIKSIGNHPAYGILFPEKMIRGLKFIIQSYRGDISRQRKVWKPVEKKISQWREMYAHMHAKAHSKPILSFQDGGTFLIIRQRRHKGPSDTHRLAGLSRKIYLLCQTNRSAKQILAAFPDLSTEQLMPFLNMMKDKRLMYGENDRHLSLAVPANG